MSESDQCEIGGRLLTIETGRLAAQADSAVTVRYGDTIVLVTVCVSDEPRGNGDFVHLTIDYEERHYAVGKIPGSFIRREGRPSQEATLAARLTDRSLRPLFDKNLHNDVQVVVTVLSTDQENDPDILAVNGASAALTLSSIPFYGPIGAVRVGYIDGNLVLNPTLPQLNDSLVDLVVVSPREAIVMVEAGAKEISEEIVLEAIKFGHEANQEIIRFQESLRQVHGKPKLEGKTSATSSNIGAAVSSEFGHKLTEAAGQTERAKREKAIKAVKQEVTQKITGRFAES